MGLDAGQSVDGRYRLAARLGEGTFGDVWRAQDTRLSGRTVAVKFLKPEFVTHAEAVARFEAEADALAQVQHPNVVGVLDRGRWQGRHFLVTEFVEGTTLAAWIESHRARAVLPDTAGALAILDQLCAGMEAAHAVRAPGPIVHRDLKPENVLLRAQPDGGALVKVLDFGIAQLGGRAGTRTGALMGTPLYMAPEQALGNVAAVGPWTDVFALGVIAAEVLTLRAQVDLSAPWWGTALARSGEVRALLGSLRVDVPSTLWDAISLALAREPSDRLRDAGALRAMLRRAATPSVAPQRAATQPLTQPTVTLAEPMVARTVLSAPPPSPGLSTTAPVERVVLAAAPARGRSARVALGAAAALALIAIVALTKARAPTPSAATAATSPAPSGETAPTPPTPPTAPTSAASAIPEGRGMRGDPALAAFFLRWNEAVIVARGRAALEPYYIERTQFRRSGGRAYPSEIARYFAVHADGGGTFSIDWSRSDWVEEDLSSPDAPRACTELAGAWGPIVKVRAWASEYTRDRAGVTGGDVTCDALEGRYLFRLRRVAGEPRICHETWSLREGVCASCPSARACARLGR